MARPPAPVHYLRANHGEWTPPAVIFLDTETRVLPGRARETLGLRLWAADYVDRRTRADATPRDMSGHGTTAAELAAWVTAATRNRQTVWLYCHNLAFDLTTTRLPLALVAAGWQVHDAAIGGRAPWLTMGKGKRVLTVADSTSWLKLPLAEVGHLVGMAKPALPGDGDGHGDWLARCRADVAILRAAMLELMGWWDAAGLGRWAISGPASGWNAYRHTPVRLGLTVPVATSAGGRARTRVMPGFAVVIDPDAATVKAERALVHGGRRGVWHVGGHAAGPFIELDLVAAYPSVAAELPLPLQRVRRFDSADLNSELIGSTRWGMSARCLLSTDVARWPMRYARRTWYPVGTFWTELAGPDIARAAELGCLRRIGPGYVHQLGHALAPWARWCLDVQDGLVPGTPAVARVVAKAWGRGVLGKWAAHAFERVKLGPAPTDAWGYEEGRDHNSDAPGGMLDMAGQRWWCAASGVPENTYPAVYGWVEAEVRTRLGRIIEALGEGCVLQCDTDGLIVAARTLGTVAAHGALVAPDGLAWRARLSWCLERLAPLVAPLRLREKAAHGHVTILGPQHVVTPAGRRFAGLPGMAEPIGGDRYRAKLWPNLGWQMRHGDPAGYVRPERTVTMAGPWPTGWLLTDGRVLPVEAELGRDGSSRLIGWNGSAYARAGLVPGDYQHPVLAGLL